VPPTRAGLLHETDVARLAAMRGHLHPFARDVARSSARHWRPSGRRTAAVEIAARAPLTFDAVRLSENIERGQRVACYTLRALDAGGSWRELARGTTIGCAKIDRFPAIASRRIQLTVDDAIDAPERVGVSLHSLAAG